MSNIRRKLAAVKMNEGKPTEWATSKLKKNGSCKVCSQRFDKMGSGTFTKHANGSCPQIKGD